MLTQNISKENETSCDEYVAQPINTGDKDYPYGGNFSTKEIKLKRYDDIGPYFVYLDINIIDPRFNNLTESFFRMNLYDPGLFFYKKMIIIIFYFDNNYMFIIIK